MSSWLGQVVTQSVIISTWSTLSLLAWSWYGATIGASVLLGLGWFLTNITKSPDSFFRRTASLCFKSAITIKTANITTSAEVFAGDNPIVKVLQQTPQINWLAIALIVAGIALAAFEYLWRIQAQTRSETFIATGQYAVVNRLDDGTFRVRVPVDVVNGLPNPVTISGARILRWGLFALRTVPKLIEPRHALDHPIPINGLVVPPRASVRLDIEFEYASQMRRWFENRFMLLVLIYDRILGYSTIRIDALQSDARIILQLERGHQRGAPSVVLSQEFRRDSYPKHPRALAAL
jgi:hypothetical protein